MKSFAGVFAVLAIASQALAVDKTELDQRIASLAMSFDVLQAKPDKRIPAETLRKAQGIVLLDLTKAGFGFAFQGGSGMAMVKNAAGQWSAPSFLEASQASFGFQAGGSQSFVVVLLMNTNTTRMLSEPVYRFGGEAGATAGNASGSVETTFVPKDQQILVYTDSEGFYGGAAAKGGSLTPNAEANVVYYGASLTPKDILFDRKAKPSHTAIRLTRKLKEASAK